MSRKTSFAGATSGLPKPPSFLKSARSKNIFKYLISSLQDASFDWSSSVIHLARVADKIDQWREYVDQLHSPLNAGLRYERDRNGGSLESDESSAERRARGEVIKDLDPAALSVISAGRIRAINRLAEQADMFGDPFKIEIPETGPLVRLPESPPWTMRGGEKKAWKDIVASLAYSTGDYSTASVSLGLLAAALSDAFSCKVWLSDNGGRCFATSEETRRTYEVSASYNRVKIDRQIRELLKKNGMTVMSCAQNKVIAKGQIVSPDLAEILDFVRMRPD
ncbi:hypothetical protein LIN78_12040 [Leeia sp. TBRC 13508]|uniref:Uncharacterized protein n=1 Tax=Leeia speluncae TaxID=2884804 RepID=A0ABS8D7W0_9NEIS|nr:hypothetical protein [Leeia speluncae]MCB6184275.1 hypothetical protein [Leeia speluncae]